MLRPPACDELFVLLFALLFALLIGSLLGAVFLRLAVFLVNKLSGVSPDRPGVPEPQYGHAYRIVFISSVVQIGVSFLIGFAMLAVTNGGNANIVRGAQLVSIPASLLAVACTFAVMLPTTLLRATLITVVYGLTQFVVVAVCVVAWMSVFGMRAS